jgi:hypothetical protein
VTVEEFESLSLAILVPGLIIYMVFIMYKLGKDSNAGKFGGFIIFLALGFGVLGFVIKEVIIHTWDM